MGKKRRCTNCMEETAESVCPHCGYREDGTGQLPYGLKKNTILHGKYLIGNVLGQGGFGITYIGFDIALELKVAVKEYYPMGYVSRDCMKSNQLSWNHSPQGQQQWKKGNENFLREARRMARLDVLPEIVRVRDIFMDNQTSYIVMDYVEGETLKAWLVKNGAMKFSECIRMLLPLMNSLNEVHSYGLIHRDISPDNIMVLRNGRVRLLDLGAAKDLGIENNGTSQLVTKKGFSPVEQYMERGKIGTWTDVYALSATIYYCITGKMVPEAIDRALAGDTLTFDVPMREPLPESVEKALWGGLAVKPEDRIQTMEELIRRLQDVGTEVQETGTTPEETMDNIEPQPQMPEETTDNMEPQPQMPEETTDNMEPQPQMPEETTNNMEPQPQIPEETTENMDPQPQMPEETTDNMEPQPQIPEEKAEASAITPDVEEIHISYQQEINTEVQETESKPEETMDYIESQTQILERKPEAAAKITDVEETHVNWKKKGWNRSDRKWTDRRKTH